MKEKPHVLIIEDTKLAQKMAQAALSSLGASFDLAETGEQALSLVKKKPYDLILLDLGLPDISGMKVLEAINKEALQPSAYVVVLTGHSDKKQQQRAINLGASEYITKPLTFDLTKQLLSKIKAPT